MDQNVKKMYILGAFWGPREGLQLSHWAYLAFQLSSHPYICTCEIRKQSDKTFLSLNPNMKNNTFFHIWGVLGGGGALRRIQVNENVRAVRPHNRANTVKPVFKGHCDEGTTCDQGTLSQNGVLSSPC